jgi:hypothetical protein
MTMMATRMRITLAVVGSMRGTSLQIRRGSRSPDIWRHTGRLSTGTLGQGGKHAKAYHLRGLVSSRLL